MWFFSFSSTAYSNFVSPQCPLLFLTFAIKTLASLLFASLSDYKAAATAPAAATQDQCPPTADSGMMAD